MSDKTEQDSSFTEYMYFLTNSHTNNTAQKGSKCLILHKIYTNFMMVPWNKYHTTM